MTRFVAAMLSPSARPLRQRGGEGDQFRPLGYFVLALCSLASASAFAAASVKPVTTLHAQVVRLSDLFADAGSDANRVLGPGPAPGGRIVVEAPQLVYIARRFRGGLATGCRQRTGGFSAAGTTTERSRGDERAARCLDLGRCIGGLRRSTDGVHRANSAERCAVHHPDHQCSD